MTLSIHRFHCAGGSSNGSPQSVEGANSVSSKIDWRETGRSVVAFLNGVNRSLFITRQDDVLQLSTHESIN